MDPKFAPSPYIGKPARQAIPDFCGRCHASPSFMKRYNPAARVDELSEYWTSRHGQLLKSGDPNVATCIDCHSVHGIRRHTDPQSPIYPTHVAQTCSRCHSDPVRMAKYGIPVDQYARWRRSVHAAAMYDRGDLTAPTCNDCHGNHGAIPPGIESVSFVCGQCHAREAELFRASAKSKGLREHLGYAATGQCAACHDDGRAKVTFRGFGECMTCHENHAVVRPTVALIGRLPDTPCAFCHEGVGPLAKVVNEPPAKRQHFLQLRDTLLAAASRLGLQGDARFDWLVEQAPNLPTHRGHPEFARLFEKFRIGKTHYTYHDVATNRDVTVAVRRCGDCHSATSTGMTTAIDLQGDTQALTSMIARAERILLAAQRGGVEVRNVRTELDNAVDSQIELEALVHTFHREGAFAEKRDEGLAHAKAALVSGQRALDELTNRRRGLYVALALIFIALVALGLKIRMG
jgi:hypothetical protein